MTREELRSLIDLLAAEGLIVLGLAGQGLTELSPEVIRLAIHGSTAHAA